MSKQVSEEGVRRQVVLTTYANQPLPTKNTFSNPGAITKSKPPSCVATKVNSTLSAARRLTPGNQDIYEKWESCPRLGIGRLPNIMESVANSNYFEAGFIFLLASLP